MENKKRFDGFAVASFVLGLIAAATYFFSSTLFINSFTMNVFIAYLLVIFLMLVLSIIFAIISLARINKNKILRGNLLALIGAVFSIITIIVIVISLSTSIGNGGLYL